MAVPATQAEAVPAVEHDLPDAGGDDDDSGVDLGAGRTFEWGVVGSVELASCSADALDEDAAKAAFWLGHWLWRRRAPLS